MTVLHWSVELEDAKLLEGIFTTSYSERTMGTRSLKHYVNSVGSHLEFVLRHLRTPADVTKPLPDPYMDDHQATLHGINFWQTLYTQASQDIAPDVREEE